MTGNAAITLTGADATGSSFTDTNLNRSSFIDVSLRQARFDDVAFTGATFSNVNLRDVALSDADVSGMTIDGVLVSEMRAWRGSGQALILLVSRGARRVRYGKSGDSSPFVSSDWPAARLPLYLTAKSPPTRRGRTGRGNKKDPQLLRGRAARRRPSEGRRRRKCTGALRWRWWLDRLAILTRSVRASGKPTPAASPDARRNRQRMVDV